MNGRASVTAVLQRTLPRRMRAGPYNTRNWQRKRGHGYMDTHRTDPVTRTIHTYGQRWLALLLAFALVLPARAEEVTAPVPIAQGEPSPVAGLVLTVPTFQAYLRQQVALEEATLRIAARDRLLAEADARAERSWWERHSFWVGIAAGTLVSFGLVWGATRVLEAK